MQAVRHSCYNMQRSNMVRQVLLPVNLVTVTFSGFVFILAISLCIEMLLEQR